MYIIQIWFIKLCKGQSEIYIFGELSMHTLSNWYIWIRYKCEYFVAIWLLHEYL